MSSSPCAILASRQQLAFCCQPNDFVVFGVDATFELGDFCVTLMTSEPFAAQSTLCEVACLPRACLHSYATLFRRLLPFSCWSAEVGASVAVLESVRYGW